MPEPTETIRIENVLAENNPVSLEPPGREGVRGAIALILIGIFFIELIFAGLSFVFKWMTFEQTKDVLSFVMAPTVGLVGAVTAFYYSSNNVPKS